MLISVESDSSLGLGAPSDREGHLALCFASVGWNSYLTDTLPSHVLEEWRPADLQRSLIVFYCLPPRPPVSYS